MPEPVLLSPLADTPRVSVLISNYNHADYIGETVQSVIQQSYKNIEIIICDDGSTDQSLEILFSLKKNKYPEILILEKENGGQASAVNATFRKCTGDIICFLDSDDLFYTDKVSSVVQTFRTNLDSGFVIHRLDKVDNHGKTFGQLPITNQLPSGWHGDYVIESGSCPPGFPVTSGLAVRRKVAEQIFPVNEKIVYDLDEMIRRLTLLSTRVSAINHSLGVYRIHGKNMTSMNVTDRLKRMLPVYDTMWMETKKYLETYSKVELKRFPELDKDLHHLLMTYVLGRIGREDRNLSKLWKEIKETRGFKSWSFTRRSFWHIAVPMPNFIFKKLVRFYWDSEGYKLYLTKFKQILGN